MVVGTYSNLGGWMGTMSDVHHVPCQMFTLYPGAHMPTKRSNNNNAEEMLRVDGTWIELPNLQHGLPAVVV